MDVKSARGSLTLKPSTAQGKSCFLQLSSLVSEVWDS